MTTSSKIKQATVEDLPDIMETFIACTSQMKKMGIDQWDYQYPDPSTVLTSIKHGEVFIIKNKKRVMGTITLNEQQDKQYEAVDWQYGQGKVLVVHRLAVHPVVQGIGYGKLLSRFAEEFAADNGYSIIRLDTYSKNPITNSMYLALGYEKAVGQCFFHGNEAPFYCYEKHLEKRTKKV